MSSEDEFTFSVVVSPDVVVVVLVTVSSSDELPEALLPDELLPDEPDEDEPDELLDREFDSCKGIKRYQIA